MRLFPSLAVSCFRTSRKEEKRAWSYSTCVRTAVTHSQIQVYRWTEGHMRSNHGFLSDAVPLCPSISLKIVLCPCNTQKYWYVLYIILNSHPVLPGHVLWSPCRTGLSTRRWRDACPMLRSLPSRITDHYFPCSLYFHGRLHSTKPEHEQN